MSNGIRLKELTIEGFRGFREPFTLDLNHNIVLLHGPNGTGKSSVLDAIEFALFGDVEHFRGEEFSITRDELINSFIETEEAKVSLRILGANGTEYHIERKKIKGAKKTPLRLVFGDQKLEEKEAQIEIDRMLKLRLRDFHSSVYLRQGLLQNMIMSGPAERARAIDSMIGIRDIDEILESIPISYASSKASELQTRIYGLESERIGALKTIRNQTKDIDKKLAERGFKGTLTIESARKVCVRISELLRTWEHGNLAMSDLPQPVDSISALQKRLDQLVSVHRGLLKTKTPEEEEMDSETGRLDSLDSEIANALVLLEDLEQRRYRIVQDRTEEAVRAKIDEINSVIRQVELENKAFNMMTTLLTTGLSILDHSKEERCPLCHLEFKRSELKKHIQGELEKIKESDAFGTNKVRIDRLQRELREHKDALENISKIDNEFRYLRDMMKRIFVEKEAIQEVDPKLFELDCELFSNQLRTVRRRFTRQRRETETRLKKIALSKEQVLSQAENDLEIVTLMIEQLVKKARLSDLEGILPSTTVEKQRLNEALGQVEEYERNLRNLCSHLEKRRTKAARKILRAISPQMNFIYGRLSPHPIYDTLKIDLERGRGRLGKRQLSYMIRATGSKNGMETFVKTIFSTAQKNVVGLSIFLALVFGATHNVDAIVLDEPDQSLDEEHKENLVDIIRETQDFKQIIVATQDSSFKEVLTSKLVPSENESRIAHDFHDWSREHGPSIISRVDHAPKIIA